MDLTVLGLVLVIAFLLARDIWLTWQYHRYQDFMLKLSRSRNATQAALTDFLTKRKRDPNLGDYRAVVELSQPPTPASPPESEEEPFAGEERGIDEDGNPMHTL